MVAVCAVFVVLCWCSGGWGPGGCGPGRGVLGGLLFFCGVAPCGGGGSISIFREFFASVGKILILGAGLGAGL